jgi:mannosyltransferase OCH1-like enzyme
MCLIFINNMKTMVWTRKLHLSFFFLDDTMPEGVAKHIEKLKAQNPSFEVKVWGPTESRDLLVSVYPEFVAKFDSFPHSIQKSDFSRYAILHAQGGVYADIDYVLKKPLEDILTHLDNDASTANKGAFVNETPNGFIRRRLSNSFMASREPGHAFWMHVMNKANNGQGLSNHQQVLTGTGPQLIDRAYWSYKQNKAFPLGFFATKYFNPCGICSRGNTCGKADYVLAYHGNDGCWNKDVSHVYNNAFCNLWWILLVLLMSVTIIVLVAVLCTKGKRQRVVRVTYH